MNKKDAREHLSYIKRAIKEFGYDCMNEFNRIKEKYKANGYTTNQQLYEDTSRMMCFARHRTLG